MSAALVLCGLLGLGWWLWPAPGATEALTPTPGSASLEAQARAALERASDAGLFAVEGLVQDAAGRPVGGATVWVYLEDGSPGALHCPSCGEELLGCGNRDTVRQLTATLSQGTLLPAPLAVSTSGPDGRFRVEGIPQVRLHLVARAEGLAGWDLTGEGVVTVYPAHEETLLLVDEALEKRPGVTVWAVLAQTMEAVRLVSGPDGKVRVRTWGEALPWVYLDDPRFVPEGSVTGEVPLQVSTPHTLLVHLRLEGKPVDGEVRIELHGPAKPLHAPHGELKLEGLPHGEFSLSASAATLRAPDSRVSLDLAVTEVTLELRASARLLLTVVDEDGQPLEHASASLQGQDATTSTSADEVGALLALGPVAEGEYALAVNADRMREFREVFDLRPGDQQRELRLRKVSVLSGQVLDAKGPVAHAQVTLTAPGMPVASGESDETGSFSIDAVPLADAVLSAQSNASGRAELPHRGAGQRRHPPPGAGVLAPRGPGCAR